MPDYSEYILIKDNKVEVYNHYRGDYTFLCDMFWGEKEARRIISNQTKGDEFKSDNAFSRIIIQEDERKVSFELYIPENEKGEGILMIKNYLDLLGMTWPGWEIHYLMNGGLMLSVS